MTAHAITLNLPETLYQYFRKRVEWTRRSLEDEVLDAVASGASLDEELTPELVESLDAMGESDDEELWRLARKTMPREASQELEALHYKQQDEGLDSAEDAIRAKLIQDYERTILIRAQAARLLKERGHDISALVAAT